jgi:hypothetical protein
VTAMTVFCGRFLTPVLIRSGADYLRFEGKDKGAKRVVATLICDADVESIAAGSWERAGVMETSSRRTLRGLREPSQRQFSV